MAITLLFLHTVILDVCLYLRDVCEAFFSHLEARFFMSQEMIVLGDEALAHAAIDSGLKAVFSYPGTPSTEIFESAEAIIHKLNDGRVAQWAANEKVAYEMALGASYSGGRSLTTL